MPFPTTDVVMVREELSARLAGIANDLRAQAAGLGRPYAGVKYPHLCVLGDVLDDAVPDMRWVHIDRPLPESIRSLADRSRGGRGSHRADDATCAALLEHLSEAKTALLAQRDPVTVRYHDLLDDTERVVADLVTRLGLHCSDEQVAAAVAMIEPAYAEHRSGPPGGDVASQSARRRSST